MINRDVMGISVGIYSLKDYYDCFSTLKLVTRQPSHFVLLQMETLWDTNV